MYVDESGDTGILNSPTRYFALSGLVVHELRWRDCLERLIELRRSFRQRYTLKLREEFHASQFISRPGAMVRIPRHQRLAMIREHTDLLATLTDLSVINILVDKQVRAQGFDVFTLAWKALIQRFENTLQRHNFPGPRNPDDRGLVFSDHTQDRKLIGLLRQMFRYNPVPHAIWFGSGYRNLPLTYVIEDANFKESGHSYFIQAADLLAFLLYQRIHPNSYVRKNGGHNYFRRLGPILCKSAAPADPEGIVRL